MLLQILRFLMRISPLYCFLGLSMGALAPISTIVFKIEPVKAPKLITVTPKPILIQNVKTPVSSNKFIEKIVPILIEERNLAILKGNKVPLLSIAIAQACIETNYGKSKLYKETNNAFGVKEKNKRKKAYLAWDDEKVKSKFKIYDDFRESVKDYNNLLKGPLYAKYLEETTPEKQIAGISKKYATNPNYVKLVMNVITTNKLKEYDKKPS